MIIKQYSLVKEVIKISVIRVRLKEQARTADPCSPVRKELSRGTG